VQPLTGQCLSGPTCQETKRSYTVNQNRRGRVVDEEPQRKRGPVGGIANIGDGKSGVGECRRSNCAGTNSRLGERDDIGIRARCQTHKGQGLEIGMQLHRSVAKGTG
jgi:hypothetical protein